MTVVAREPMTRDEIRFAREVQVDLGLMKLCEGCGTRKSVLAFPSYGAAWCRECAGVEPWL